MSSSNFVITPLFSLVRVMNINSYGMTQKNTNGCKSKILIFSIDEILIFAVLRLAYTDITATIVSKCAVTKV